MRWRSSLLPGKVKMYNWVLVIMLMTADGPKPLFEKQYEEAKKCYTASYVIDKHYADLRTACFPVYKTDGGSWRQAEKVHDRT